MTSYTRYHHSKDTFDLKRNLSTVFANSFGNYAEDVKPEKIRMQAEYIAETAIKGDTHFYGTTICDRKRVIAVMDYFP